MKGLKIALFLLALASFGASNTIFELGFKTTPPGVAGANGVMHRYKSQIVIQCAQERMKANVGLPQAQWRWSQCEREFSRTHTLGQFNLRYGVLTGGALSGFLFACLLMLVVRFAPQPPRVVRGRKYLRGRSALSALDRHGRKERRQSGAGLMFPPGLPMSRDRESRHFLFWGSVGSGKTQTLLHLMMSAICRGDKVLVLDVKGDITASLPGRHRLLAPQDARSESWMIAEDCRTRQDARELAARIIPESQDRMWSDAAREVFVACIASLQATRGERWGWKDLYDVTVRSSEDLLTIARTYHPEAARLLTDPASRTTMSVLTTFQAHMSTIGLLAEAWPEARQGVRGKGFSVRRWIREPDASPIIVQQDGRFPMLSKAWISGLIGLLACEVASPALEESSDRRIWLFLDEFPQLDRLDQFSSLLDVGRSKGVVVVLGAQDIAQIRRTYGHDQADAWIGMIGTHVITRLNFGAGAEMASRLIGDQTIERRRRSHSTSMGRTTETFAIAHETRPVVTPSELSDRLGPMRDGVRILLIGPGEDAYELLLPYCVLPPQRPASDPAAWVNRPPLAASVQPEAGPRPSLPVVPAVPATSSPAPACNTPLSPALAARIREAGR